jgi:hypothetical protein
MLESLKKPIDLGKLNGYNNTPLQFERSGFFCRKQSRKDVRKFKKPIDLGGRNGYNNAPLQIERSGYFLQKKKQKKMLKKIK